ncbi:reverse transcriptase domain-containing protein [Tanacetum coccineum]
MNEAQENYTTTEKELLAVVFAFDKFCQYLVLSKTIVFTGYSALRYLFTKQDVKPRLIRWILLLQGFNIEIRDKKGAKNLAADHLSRLENPDLGKLTKAKIWDLFPEERLMAVSDKNNEPWMNRSYSRNVLTELYEGASPEMRQHKSFSNVIADHLEDIMVSPLLQETSLKPISTYHISFATHAGWSKFAMHVNEPAQAFPTSDARNVVNFLKRLFARFRIPKALISDRGTHFCNYQIEKAMKRYGVVHRFSTAYHPQTNGHVENINWAIKHILEKTIENNRKDWSYKLDDALWSFRIAFKTQLGTTSFRINYGKACHLPVLLFNSHLRLSWKLKSRWYEPFSVSKDMKNGAIELYDEDANEFIVNKQRVKPYQKNVLNTNRDDDITLDDEGEVTLYMARRSLEVLRKFHWTILGGQFNQLSHVSSPLLSRPGEY